MKKVESKIDIFDFIPTLLKHCGISAIHMASKLRREIDG
jgi:hypothetical protein